MPEQSKMEISLFSGMTILWNGTPILEHSARLNKPLELLALLLLRGDKKLTNEQLMDGLWESDEIENPAGALKNAAYSLRKFLQKADKEKRFIITESGRYIWNPEISVTTDVWEFEQEARLADQPGTPAEERIPHARRALKLYTRAGGRGRAFAFCFCGVDSGRRIQSDTMAAERRMGGRGRGSCAVRYTAGRIGGDAWTSGKRSDRPLKWVRLIFLLSPACRLPIRWTAARGGWKRG